MKRQLLLTVVALAVTSTPTYADHLSGNLRDLTTADLCPLAAYVTIDDDEDDKYAAELEQGLTGALTRGGLQLGDDKTCIADLTLSIDAFTDDDDKITYAAKITLDLDVADTTTFTIGTRRISVGYLTLWDSTSYGTFNDMNEFLDGLADNLTEDLGSFIADWKTTHR